VKALLFAGTTEGRAIAQAFAENSVPSVVWFATKYGMESSGIAPGGAAQARQGRLSEAEMESLIRTQEFTHVIDATHPYAALATGNIREAASKAGAEYMRVLRGESPFGREDAVVPTVRDAARYLAARSGRALVTTGSKDLKEYTAVPSFSSRIHPRILPQPESLAEAVAMGFSPANMILMQGPFSEEMNLACLRHANAAFLVTKASGEAGGVSEKLSAAGRFGAKAVIVARPVQEEGVSVAEALESLGIRRYGEKPSRKRMFPFYIGLEGKKALFVGGGKVAMRRIATLLSFSLEITVVSPFMGEGLLALAERGEARLVQRPFEKPDVQGFDIVIAASDSAEVNRQAAEAARSAGVPFVNNASDASDSGFYFPAVVHWGQATIAIASDAGPSSHAQVRQAADMARALFSEAAQ
jgi:precorrin-2 dehydrogenase/sirohydrochlorin ferrochelatase/precorrin-6A/cobalt-precorrin-6A reductase